MVHTLASEYGWSYATISDDMYWEDVYEMYELASNMGAIERNDEMRFNFMLHAQTKDALNKWKDLPIPFPDRRYKPAKQQAGSKFMPRPFASRSKAQKATPEEKKRFEEVSRRLKEHQERVQEANRRSMYGF